MKRMQLLALLVILAGCSHDLTLVDRDNGQQGTGTATGWNGSGNLTVQLNGKTYAGNWVSVAGGSIGSFAGFGGTTPFTGLGTSESTSSSGTALLNSEDGSRLRCAFVFGSFSNTGYGECQDEKKKMYDLQIH